MEVQQPAAGDPGRTDQGLQQTGQGLTYIEAG